MKIVWCIVFLTCAYHCDCRSLPEAAENISTANDNAGNSKKVKSGYFRIPKTKKEVQIHDILHHLKGAILEKHVNSDDGNSRKKRATDYESDEKEEYCAPRYNLGSSVYHKDVTIEAGGSVVNIGNLYLYQYSADGEYTRQIPVPGFNMPMVSRASEREQSKMD